MKQIPLFAGMLILFSLSGCVPPPPAANLLPMEYMHTASALAVDDVDKARESLIALAKVSNGDLQTRAQAAAGTADIEAMRESFKTLTEEVAVNMSYPDEYAVAFCPKYKDGSKWIQKREAPILNPYFGKSMQTCGSFVD
jgi:hypothetical protein